MHVQLKAPKDRGRPARPCSLPRALELHGSELMYISPTAWFWSSPLDFQTHTSTSNVMVRGQNPQGREAEIRLDY